MLKHHAHLHARLVDILKIFLIKRFDCARKFLAFAFFQQIFRLDFGNDGGVQRFFSGSRIGIFCRKHHRIVRFAFAYHVEMQIRIDRR